MIVTTETRLATELEEMQLRARFPSMSRADVTTDAFIAMHGDATVGAAVVSVDAARNDPAGPGCWIESRDGTPEVEEALLAAIERHAIAGGARALFTMTTMREDDQSVPAWERLGFIPETDATWMRVDVAHGARAYSRLLERRAGAFRDGATIHPWEHSDDSGVAKLQRHCFGGTAERAQRFVERHTDLEWNRDWSAIARVDGAVVGMCLVGLDLEGRAVVASLGVDEAYRKSSLVMRLLAHSCARGEMDGVESARMLIGERGGQARRLVERLGGVEESRTVRLWKPLEAT
ncbi:MAG: GNAT family N-acetyltransferase [Planctomycetota bacterium]